MTAADFDFVVNLLRERSAIVLEQGKEYLITSRLTPVAERRGLASVDAFIQKLRAGGEAEVEALIDAMVTTESLFFRDGLPFDTLRQTVLPELIAARQATKRLNVWCAASSTGQEPYSIALMLKDHFPELRDWQVSLLATDISRDVLRKAALGRFSQMEVNRGMPPAMLTRYFRRDGVEWELAPDLRGMVEFRQLNLAQQWPGLPRMDLVFLRNVMIYFEADTKRSILTRVADLLAPDGYLVLGGAETTFHLVECFERVDALKGGYYRVKR